MNGKPNPYEMRGSSTVMGALKPGTVLANAVAVTEKVTTAGAARIRLRIKLTCAAVLSSVFLRPDGETAYSANNPADVVIGANTETKLDIDHWGEGVLLLSLLPGGAGAVNYIDVSQV